MSWRSGAEKDLDEVLQTTKIFGNVSKGVLAKNSDLQGAFKTDDEIEICKKILEKGELQVSEKERLAQKDDAFKEIATIIATKCINPDTKKPYTVSMIEKALHDIHYNASGADKSSSKKRALQAISELKEHIPLVRARMNLKITLPGSEGKKIREKWKKDFGDDFVLDNETFMGQNMVLICQVDPGVYRLIDADVSESTRGKGSIEICQIASTLTEETKSIIGKAAAFGHEDLVQFLVSIFAGSIFSTTHNLMTSRIRSLADAVVDRIAAGEVIQRPSSAVKEMIENSLDAGATRISLVLQDGGFKVLQIQDNGGGIMKEDFPILCQRFTTSKIKDFDDLKHVKTYGFRGEALASISQVARVTITSMTAEDPCAHRGSFIDGSLVNNHLESIAGNIGTLIRVEDMFYNLPTRRKALGMRAEEYTRVLDLIGKYAIMYPHISFSVKKLDKATSDFNSSQGKDIPSVVRNVYGADVAKMLTPLAEDSFTLESETISYKVMLSRGDTHLKGRSIFICFINGRLVECTALRKTVDAAFQDILPRGARYFALVILNIPYHWVDCNIHPNKAEVSFLHEETITSSISTFCVLHLQPAVNDTHVMDLDTLHSNSRNVPRKRTIGGETAESASASNSQPWKKNRVESTRGDQRLDDMLVQGVWKHNSDGLSHSDMVASQTSVSGADRQIAVHALNEWRGSLVSLLAQLTVPLLNHSVLHLVGSLSASTVLLQVGTSLHVVDMQVLTQLYWYHFIVEKISRNGMDGRNWKVSPAIRIDGAHLVVGDKWHLFLTDVLGLGLEFHRDNESLEEDHVTLVSVPVLDPTIPPVTKHLQSFCSAASSQMHGSKPLLSKLEMLLIEFASIFSWHGNEDSCRLFYLSRLERARTSPALLSRVYQEEVASLHQLYKVFERC